MSPGQVAGKTEAEYRQEIHERRRRGHDDRERKGLFVIKGDGLPRLEDQEPGLRVVIEIPVPPLGSTSS